MPTLDLERQLQLNGCTWVVGVDEAGRGPLAGPVVAGAVVLPADITPFPGWLDGIDDSKKLTSARREEFLERIYRLAAAVGLGMAGHEEIDDCGIGVATRRAMLRAIDSLAFTPDHVLVDFVPSFECGIASTPIVGGDGLSYSIAAASIVAKVTRDRLMVQADKEYPNYSFSRHKGYPTLEHLGLLQTYGPCPIHRRSFAPVANVAGRSR